MKILLLGATGRLGRQVLAIALERGFTVNCLSRNSERIAKLPGVRLFEGSTTNRSAIERAIKGCTYVVSTLNISRKSDFPWSPLRTPKQYLSETMTELIPISENNQIERLIICSAWGVADSRKNIPWWFRFTIDYSNISVAYKDHERQEKLVEDSNLKWTIVRPVGLSNSKKTQNIQESQGNTPNINLTISRKSVAKFIINSLGNDSLVRKKVVVSKY